MMRFKYKLLFFYSYIFLLKIVTTQKSTKFINLWESKQCKNEITDYCNESIDKINSKLMSCLQAPNVIKKLSDECQHFLWEYKSKYLDTEFFNYVTHNYCKTELTKYNNCHGAGSDENVICLIKHKSEVSNTFCSSQLNEVAAIVFSDAIVINKFLSSCSESIYKLKCGRLESENNTFSSEKFISRITSQGKTIECLIDSLNSVTKDCRIQILRLGELQSNDFHLNPTLYYSCREDRESLCGKIEAGSSRVYKCLESKKSDKSMSILCRNALRQKHQLESHDYKIRGSFSEKCAKDISEHKCSVSEHTNEIINLEPIIMCLLHPDNRKSLQPNCIAELKLVRSQMAQNINMFPEMKKTCQKEIENHCSNITYTNGDTIIHCLMRYSMPSLELGFNKACLQSIKNYVQTVDPTEDIQELDPLISQACSNELNNICNPTNYIEPNDRYACLLGLIDEDKAQKDISEDCKTNLLTLAHFVEQEYSLNHKLFAMCHSDAVKFCGAEKKSYVQSASVVPQAILHCLLKKWNIQYLSNEQPVISYRCSVELKSVMKIEANNVMLNFKIYTACSTDLLKVCSSEKQKMDCLQLKYNELSNICKSSISKFLSLDAEEYSLKKLITRSCSPMVKKFCKTELKNKEKNYMECLMNYKFDKDMDDHCKIAIEHYQIIGLDNYKIDHKFARFCATEIKRFCSNLLPNPNVKENENDSSENENGVTAKTQTSKSDIVSCLSKELTISLLNKKNEFSAQCFEQFTFEFLQITNSVNHDPELKKMCDSDIAKWCSSEMDENKITCLHRYQDTLKEQCFNLLVSRQQLGALDSRFDVAIQKYCYDMIKSYCHDIPSHKVFRCLHKNMRITGFNGECKKKVLKRLERRLVDLRLNPELLDNCRDEINAHCNKTDKGLRVSNLEFKDKYHIINCLRNVFMEHRKFLGGFCRRIVFDIVLDAHSFDHLDPGLYDVCYSEIKTMCSESLVENNVLAGNKVQDCLKHNLLSGTLPNEKCNKEVYRLLREGLADIHVDPQLYSSCTSEISRICPTEALGQGRKLSCLLWALEDKKMSTFLTPSCRRVLQERKEMWEFATKMESPKSASQFVRLIYESESRNYFMLYIVMLLGLMMLIGIMCGRYTRKVSKQVRNRR